MVQATQNSQEKNTQSIQCQITDEICSKLAWIVDKTVTKPLHALSSLAQAVAAPVLYGSIALTALHIAIRPTKSQDITLNLLNAIPEAVDRAILYAPTALTGAIDIAQRVYRASLNTLGEKVGIPNFTLQISVGKTGVAASASKPTLSLSTVLAGVATYSVQRVKNCRPAGILSSLDSLLTYSEQGLTKMWHYSKETAAPWAVKQFNTTFPKV